MSLPVRCASRDELPAVVSVMNEGFASDPLVRWVLTDDEIYETMHGAFVEVVAEPAFGCQSVHMHTDGKGAAIWHPPGVTYDASSLMESPLLQQIENAEKYFSLVEACAAYAPSEPHWTLELLSVKANSRGQGIGAELLSYGLRECDRTDNPVYLESSNPANLSLYARHGFELQAEVQLPGTPKRLPMIRPAH